MISFFESKTLEIHPCVDSECRKGACKTMDCSICDEIFVRAKPYLNTRHNEIHTVASCIFARKLLKYYSRADDAIVLPSILLHDVGWKMIPEEKQLDGFGPKNSDESIKRLHEIGGVQIAGDILSSLGYPSKKIEGILAIIHGHDTRQKPLSLNDKLVKDADKLWRYAPQAVSINCERFRMNKPDYLIWLQSEVEGRLFTVEAKSIARELSVSYLSSSKIHDSVLNGREGESLTGRTAHVGKDEH